MPVDLSKRCELCDLPLVTCPHNPDRPVEHTPVPAPAAITAKYDGRCPECHEPIRAGIDLIVPTIWGDGKGASRYVHAEGGCADD